MRNKDELATKAQDLGLQTAKLRQKITRAFSEMCGEEAAQDVAFHFTDWESDLVYLLQLYQNPEAFSDEEVLEGLLAFLAHAPNHMAAAKKLGGMGPIQEVFEVGVLEEDED